jgi:NADH-quinone oxidoreductase subunit G
MVNRGWKKELVTAGDEGMHNDYQGCVVDICPVGALTFTDFRFQKRVWFLKSMPSVCDRCSKGCNISVDQEKNIIYRYRPEYNAKVNGHWMCDEGRKSYHDSMNPDRGVTPALKEGSELSATTWDQAAVLVSQSLKQAKKVMFVIGTDTTTEEAQALMDDLPKLCTGTVDFRFHNGTDGVTSSDDDEPLDTILRRKDKTPNTKGLEALGLKPWKSSSADVSILVRFMRAGVPKEKTGTIEIALGAWKIAELESRKVHAFLPGLVTAEKAGSYTNCDGVIQTFKPAVKHTGDGRTFADMLNVLKLAKGLK